MPVISKEDIKKNKLVFKKASKWLENNGHTALEIWTKGMGLKEESFREAKGGRATNAGFRSFAYLQDQIKKK